MLMLCESVYQTLKAKWAEEFLFVRFDCYYTLEEDMHIYIYITFRHVSGNKISLLLFMLCRSVYQTPAMLARGGGMITPAQQRMYYNMQQNPMLAQNVSFLFSNKKNEFL